MTIHNIHGIVTLGVFAPSSEFTVQAEDIVSTTTIELNGSRKRRRHFESILSRCHGCFMLMILDDPLTAVHVRLPDDHFSVAAGSHDTVYALTTSGVLYYLPRGGIREESPCWSVRPMPCVVRKIDSIPDRRGRRLECLALLCDGTLWMLNPEGNVPMPTFQTALKPTDSLVDDVFCSTMGYAVVRYKRFAVEVVPRETFP
jgi:hypothetical protein